MTGLEEIITGYLNPGDDLIDRLAARYAHPSLTAEERQDAVRRRDFDVLLDGKKVGAR